MPSLYDLDCAPRECRRLGPATEVSCHIALLGENESGQGQGACIGRDIEGYSAGRIEVQGDYG
jgi:hypothetical protein